MPKEYNLISLLFVCFIGQSFYMIYNINIPTLKVFVIKSYLTQNIEDSSEVEPAYLISAKCVSGRAILFTVHLESGAIFSGLPIESLRCTKFSKNFDLTIKLSNEDLQPYSCLDGNVQLIEYSALKDYKVRTRLGEGRYLFTIDYSDGNLTDDPEQYKTHNIIVLNTGFLCALPNNYCLFLDNHFTENKDIPKYKRNTTYWLAGS